VKRYWLGLASALHAVVFAWAAHTLPWRPEAPLGLVLWALAVLHAATAICALGALAATPRVWRVLSIASLGAAALLSGAIAVGAERMVVMFGLLGWNLTALLAVIGVLVLGLTLPMGLWGLKATEVRAAPRSVEALEADAQPLSSATKPPAVVDWTQVFSGRSRAYLVGAGTLLAVLWPLCTGRDSFPLSNYPMFSHPRGQPVLFSVVATSAAGNEWNVPSALVGSDEVLQTKALIQRAVDGGQAAMARLCEDVASRLTVEALGTRDRARQPDAPAGSEPPLFVDIVSRRYDPVQYFVAGPSPIEEKRLYRCDIADPARPVKKAKKGRRSQ
jgi:hypothetical protein